MFCDAKYKACYELYNDVSEALKGDRLSLLERLTLQYHVMGESPVPIAEVLHRRMEGLKEGQRDLRVYIAGMSSKTDRTDTLPQSFVEPKLALYMLAILFAQH